MKLSTTFIIVIVFCLSMGSRTANAQFTNPNEVDTTPASVSGVYSDAYQSAHRSELVRKIMPHLNHPDFENAIWGVHVIDLNTKATLFNRNAQTSMMPASNTKLYTTAAALELLGADFRYNTNVWGVGTLSDGTFRGNIVIEGSGDPTISGRYTDDDRTLIFRQWATDLREQGIHHIDGNIIGDDTLFDGIPLGNSWSWDYTTYWYAAEMGALSFNENCIDIEIIGTRPGQPAKINILPGTTYGNIINETMTVRRGERTFSRYDRPWTTNTMTVGNHVAAGDTVRYSLSVTNPAMYFVHVLREVLIEEGITVSGEIYDRNGLSMVGDYHNSGRILTTYTSPTLAEIVYILNQRSQNMFAENLLKTMGAYHKVQELTKSGGSEQYVLASARDGFRAAWPVFAAAGVDTTRLRLADGSGLSRINVVAPSMTTSLLHYMWHHPNDNVREAFINSLPRAGEEIGTLRNMFARGAARESVAAKTGTIGMARALSGYVTAADGTPLAFSIMVNHYTVSVAQANRIIESVVNTLAGFSFE